MVMRESINAPVIPESIKSKKAKREKAPVVEKREIPMRLMGEFKEVMSQDVDNLKFLFSQLAEKFAQLKQMKKLKDFDGVASYEEQIALIVEDIPKNFLIMANGEVKVKPTAGSVLETLKTQLMKGQGIFHELQYLMDKKGFEQKYQEYVLTNGEAYRDVLLRASDLRTQKALELQRESMAIGQMKKEIATRENKKEQEADQTLAIETSVMRVKNLSSLAEVIGSLEDITRPDGSLINMREQAKFIKLLSDPNFSSKSMLVDYLTRQYGIRQRAVELMKPQDEVLEKKNLRREALEAQDLAVALHRLLNGTAKPGEWINHNGNEYSIDKSRKIRVRKSGVRVPGVYMKKEEQAMLQEAFQDRLEFLRDASAQLDADLRAAVDLMDLSLGKPLRRDSKLQATMNMEDARLQQEKNPELSYSEAKKKAQQEMTAKLVDRSTEDLIRAIEQIYQVDVVNPSARELRLIQKFAKQDRDFAAMYKEYQSRMVDQELMRGETQEVMSEEPVVKKSKPAKVSWFKKMFGGRG